MSTDWLIWPSSPLVFQVARLKLRRIFSMRWTVGGSADVILWTDRIWKSSFRTLTSWRTQFQVLFRPSVGRVHDAREKIYEENVFFLNNANLMDQKRIWLMFPSNEGIKVIISPFDFAEGVRLQVETLCLIGRRDASRVMQSASSESGQRRRCHHLDFLL